MGKRQIGELQPYELVVTILISEIASKPIQNMASPLATAIVPVLVLISLEVIVSYISRTNRKIRSLVSGHPIPVVINGIIDQATLKNLRLSVDDLMNCLRQQKVFDIKTVEFAIIETNGKLSVYKKNSDQELTAKTMNIQVVEEGPPLVLVDNGNLVISNLDILGKNRRWFDKILKRENYILENIFIMTCNNSGNYHIIPKEKFKAK
jgi:uncharacterized membrane protein YcaP (DUF421 family)